MYAIKLLQANVFLEFFIINAFTQSEDGDAVGAGSGDSEDCDSTADCDGRSSSCKCGDSGCWLPGAEVESADCILVVYSIADRATVAAARHILAHVQEMTRRTNTPLTLLGNKLDLHHCRQVSQALLAGQSATAGRSVSHCRQFSQPLHAIQSATAGRPVSQCRQVSQP